jgi:hypothetical protein
MDDSKAKTKLEQERAAEAYWGDIIRRSGVECPHCDESIERGDRWRLDDERPVHAGCR